LGTGGIFLRKLRAKVFERPTGFVWVEDARLAGSGYPASRSQLKWVSGKGIKTVVTLTESPLPPQWLEGLDLEVHHIPMKDHLPPGRESLDAAARTIQESLGRGKATLVHCLAGQGRTGCVLAAYLIRSRGIAAGEAIATLRSISPLFVEQGQESSITEYGLVARSKQ